MENERSIDIPEIPKSLKLEDVASWSISGLARQSTLRAALPALQRGFVWNASQIEMLWDSLIQGFPIGSLLLAPYDEEKGSTAFKGQDSDINLSKPLDVKNTLHLLDGQQRATAIGMGFRDVWTNPSENIQDDVHAALWMDIVPLKNDERKFAFRVVTKSHPWGYSRSNPSSKLTASQARDAINVFRKVSGCEQKLPHEFRIHEVFPLDAEAPVPLALLLAAIKDGDDVITSLGNMMKKASLNEERIEKAIDAMKKDDFRQLEKTLRNLIDRFEIPIAAYNPPNEAPIADEHDPVFNLFKRLNTGGTQLSTEEIKYSMLKTAWPEAPEVIENEVLKGRNIAQPARIVSLLSRLYRMKSHKTKNSGLQPELSLQQFRTLIIEEKEGFQSFCKGDGKKIIERAWQLMAGKDHGLPKILAAQITQNSSELMLLLMYWLLKLGDGFNSLSEDTEKRTLGFITSLAWFAQDQKRAVTKLAKTLTIMSEEQPDSFFEFFNHERFSEALLIDEQNRIHIAALPSPGELQSFILNEGLKESLALSEELEIIEPTDTDGDLWKKENLWNHYNGVDGLLPTDWQKDNPEKRKEATWPLVDRICMDRNRHLLMYAQRKFIKGRFNWFDPTQPDQIRERNRPWDYDHILPQSWTQDGRGTLPMLPHLVRIWVWTVGNFRAWPLELNRSKGNSEVIRENEYEDSFVNKAHWSVFDALDPKQARQDFCVGNNQIWQDFVKASMLRTVDIYREWYDEMQIKELMR